RKPVIFVKNINKEFYKAVDNFYRLKNDKLRFVGVTGTNGKTTTSHFIGDFLRYSGKQASLIGTLTYKVGAKVYNSTHTTPEYLSLKKMIKHLDGRGDQFIVMEVSSHAIDQKRIEGIGFEVCVFTNLTRDHLDYHKTIKNYFDVKRLFFINNKRCMAVINVDDSYGRRLRKDVLGQISYGIDRRADLGAANIKLAKEFTVFDLIYKGKRQVVKTSFLGRHNVSNILAAAGAVLSLGISFEMIVGAIPFLKAVPGRLEKVANDIFVDYAHTPDAIEKVLIVLKQIGYGRIVLVFGCGGDRDKGKRVVMGRLASSFSTFSIITSDNPRGECPNKICSQIAGGFRNNNYQIIVDREEAIKKAISVKSKYKNCCVLIAGKGHEEYQIIGDKTIQFSDSEVVKSHVAG
ncbi:MAG: UDP-N-acetylmuramoyl-L-alanyl-D-glutamate--2,6-diaminopimelate ligase, partial [Candidatus Omnitrophica bacterium]|nr:UDP-N-acetylmuramoyl-L-alanyl-D-glutamate--2,6-diaminopimelate ligase [Candidatus Omnitrophota bacterium]